MGKIKLGKIRIIFKIYKEYEQTVTFGVTNRCETPHHIVFLDYDEVLLDEVLIPELRYFQHRYGLSDFYIFKSSQKPRSYHAICIDKLDARTWMKLLKESCCDENYKKMPLICNKLWVLRCFGKADSKMPEIIKILGSQFQKRKKSNAHALFLKNHYGINIDGLKNLDESEKVILSCYPTNNFIKQKV